MDAPGIYEISIAKGFKFTVWHRFMKSLRDHELVSPGERIGVCLSGGRGSALAGVCMSRLQRYSKFPFEVELFTAGENVPPELVRLGYEIKPAGGTDPVEFALSLGCNKLAEGELFDDIIEEIVEGVLYRGEISPMLPRQRVSGLEIIRPLYFVRERDAISWESGCGEPFVTPDPSPERAAVRQLLARLREKSPEVDMNILRSIQNVNLQTLMGWTDSTGRHHFLDTYGEGRSVRGV